MGQTNPIRPIDAERFKRDTAAMAVSEGYDSRKALALIELIDKQPTIALTPQEGIPKPDAPVLVRCKFCGGKAMLFLSPDRRYADEEPKHQGHYVACAVCGCRTADFIDPYNAVFAWNRTPKKESEE